MTQQVGSSEVAQVPEGGDVVEAAADSSSLPADTEGEGESEPVSGRTEAEDEEVVILGESSAADSEAAATGIAYYLLSCRINISFLFILFAFSIPCFTKCSANDCSVYIFFVAL